MSDNVFKMDETERQFAMEISGRTAMFATPTSKFSIEKYSYEIPTLQALTGICERAYWKPTFLIVVDKVRVMNPIEYESQGVKIISTMNELEKYDLCHYNYLSNVRYRVLFHIMWDENRDDLKQDRNAIKHWNIMQRSLNHGGRLPVFLGCSECPCTIEAINPRDFDDGTGAYDNTELMVFRNMFHSYLYEPNSQCPIETRFFNAKMKKGIVDFNELEESDLTRYKIDRKPADKKSYYIRSHGFKTVDDECIDMEVEV